MGASEETIELLVERGDSERRLDQFLASHAPREIISRSFAASLIERGFVRVNGQVVTKGALKVREGFRVQVVLPAPEPLLLQPDPSVVLDLVYEDESVLVINKPAGVVVHPGAGHHQGTLAHGVLAHLGEQAARFGTTIRPGFVHRLDKDTTGVMVVAKNPEAQQYLVRLFRSREISREYLALTLRVPGAAQEARSGVIDAAIARHQIERKQMAISRTGRPAQTAWEVEEELRHGYVLRLRLATGRTHQIRVHLKSMGAAVVGDQTYRSSTVELPRALAAQIAAFGRQALHATRLTFKHPMSGESVSFTVPPPADFIALQEAFRQ